jgi:MFS family permease
VTSDGWHRRSPLVFLFVTVFVDMIGYGIVVPLLPFYASLYASGAVLLGLLGSLYVAMQFVGGPFLGGLSDRHGRRPVLLLCLLGTSLAYLLLAQTLASLVVAVVLAGVASGTLATTQAYIADSTAKEDRARGLRPDRGGLRARPHGRTSPRRPPQPPLIGSTSPLRLSPGPHQLRLRLHDPP